MNHTVSLANTHSSQIFLGEAFILPALLDHLPYFQRHSLMAELLCLSVQLGCVLGHKMLFVLSSSPFKKINSFNSSKKKRHIDYVRKGFYVHTFLRCFDGISLPLSRYNGLKQKYCYCYVKQNSTNICELFLL